MLNIILNNAGTILVSLVLIGIVMLIIVSMRRDRAKGRSSCGSNCGCCPMSGACHKRAEGSLKQ